MNEDRMFARPAKRFAPIILTDSGPNEQGSHQDAARATADDGVEAPLRRGSRTLR